MTEPGGYALSRWTSRGAWPRLISSASITMYRWWISRAVRALVGPLRPPVPTTTWSRPLMIARVTIQWALDKALRDTALMSLVIVVLVAMSVMIVLVVTLAPWLAGRSV